MDDGEEFAYRCVRCNKLILYATGLTGVAHVDCPRCRLLNTIRDGAIVTLAPSAERLRVSCNKERRVRPMTTEEAVALLEERWALMWKRKAYTSALVATGIRFRVFDRDGFRCRYCGRAAEDGAVLEADHVTPRSKGGPDTMDNLVTACWECNNGKSSATLLTPFSA